MIGSYPPDPGVPAESVGQGGTGPVRSAGLSVGEEGTGDQRVDAAMAQLAAMTGRPAAERVGVYEAVHRALQDTLATVDEA